MRDIGPIDGYSVPFSARATARDIFYCFRLLLGRYPHPEEWRGHALRVGDDLNGVVGSFVRSLECRQRGMITIRDSERGLPVETAIEGFTLFSDPADALVGGPVRAGSYEPEICALFRKILRPGQGVLDIGANIGVFSMLSASLVGPEGHVVAVEPNPRNVRLLEASRRRNGFDTMTVLQVAAGDKAGLLVLNTSYSNGTTSALPADLKAILDADTVPAVRLDAVLPTDRRIDLIKIDVEGAEYVALRGCEALIRAHRPAIISEFSPGLMPGISGIDGPGYLAWLVDLGYALSVVMPDGSLVAAGTDIDAVMDAYRARLADHIDIFASFV